MEKQLFLQFYYETSNEHHNLQFYHLTIQKNLIKGTFINVFCFKIDIFRQC